MANGFFTHGMRLIQDGTINLSSSTIGVMLMQNTYEMSPTQDFIADISSHELSVTNYARKTLASKAFYEDDTNHWCTFDADDPSNWAALGEGQYIEGAVIYQWTGSDATAVLLCWLDFSVNVPTGGDFALAFSPGGIVRWRHP